MQEEHKQPNYAIQQEDTNDILNRLRSDLVNQYGPQVNSYLTNQTLPVIASMIQKYAPLMIKENSSYSEIYTTLCAYINNILSGQQQNSNNNYNADQLNPPTANSYRSGPDSSLKRLPPLRPKESKEYRY